MSQSCHDGLERAPKDFYFLGWDGCQKERRNKKLLHYLLNFESTEYLTRDFYKVKKDTSKEMEGINVNRERQKK